MALGGLAVAQTEVLPRPADCRPEHAAESMPVLHRAYLEGRIMNSETGAVQVIAELERQCGPTSPILLRPLSILAVIRLELGKVTAARATVDRIGKLHIERPEQRAVASALSALLLHTEGRLRDAERQYRESYSHFAEAGLDHTASAGTVLNGLGVVLMAEGRAEEARGALDRAVAVLGSASDAAATDMARALSARSSLNARQRAWGAAEQDLREAISIADKETVPEPVLQKLLTDYALVLRKNHRASEARALERRAAALPRTDVGKSMVDASQLAPGTRP